MFMLLVYLLLPLLALYYLLTKNYGYWESQGVPYDKPFFIFGSFYKPFARKEHMFNCMRKIYDNFKSHPYMGIYIFNRPTLIIRSPELIRKVLVKDFDKFVNRTVATNIKSDPIAFHSMFSSKDNVWKNIRSRISPVFTSGKMKLMLPLIKESAKDLTNHIQNQNGNEIETKLLMQQYAVDVISSCAFGINSNCLKKQENNEVWQMSVQLMDARKFIRGFSMFSFAFVPKFVDWFKLTFMDPEAAKYFINVFTGAYKERKQMNIVRNDLIDLLHNLKDSDNQSDGFKFNDLIMSAQALAFFTAGKDTTAITLAYTLYELVVNEEIQNRLRKDVLKSIEKHGELTYESIQEMKYLDMVLNETLRKYPLTSFLNRKTSNSYTIEETGYTIEKDVSILIPVSGLHFDPEYFPDPEKFDPERFSDENKGNIVPYSYLPFGEGPRNCIGQRFAVLVSKIALASIVKEFVIVQSPSTPKSIEFEPKTMFLLNKGGLFVKFEKIQ